MNIIQQHDPSVPLFLYHAWQEVACRLFWVLFEHLFLPIHVSHAMANKQAHTPNEVPDEFLGPKLPDDNDQALRQTYEGMVHCLDSGIGNITTALRAKGMWNRTLIVFSSDNGGREDGGFGGNNWPLRGVREQHLHCIVVAYTISEVQGFANPANCLFGKSNLKN